MTPDTTIDSPTLTPLPEAAHDPAPVATGPQAARAEDQKQAVRDQIATQLPIAARTHYGIPGRCGACSHWNADAGRCQTHGFFTSAHNPACDDYDDLLQ